MTKIYTCDVCGMVTEMPRQICEPRRVTNKQAYCGTPPERDKMCEEIKEHFAYVCGSCGRPAKQAELLCVPLMAG